MAIQILKALASATTVVAVDTSPDKREIAKAFGADSMAAKVARVLGHLTIVGVGNASLPVNFPARRTKVPSRHRSGVPFRN